MIYKTGERKNVVGIFASHFKKIYSFILLNIYIISIIYHYWKRYVHHWMELPQIIILLEKEVGTYLTWSSLKKYILNLTKIHHPPGQVIASTSHSCSWSA